MLVSPDARLNDVCVNGCAALIYSENLEHNASQVTVFSTHDLPVLGTMQQTRICGITHHAPSSGRKPSFFLSTDLCHGVTGSYVHSIHFDTP